MKKSEADIKASIRNWLNKHECHHHANSANYMTGLPDRTVTIKMPSNYVTAMGAHLPVCTVIGLEVKAEGKDATKKQAAKLKELTAAGWITGVVRSWQDVEKLFTYHGIVLNKK